MTEAAARRQPAALSRPPGAVARGFRKGGADASGEYELLETRTKHKPTAPMHLKSYQIDGRLLRTGAANFSASGLKRQDNDLIVIESTEAAAAFKRVFDGRFASGETLQAGVKQ
jgi:phosphatidylserine/phosphatidylglycerophosphate/cardiolipin synthase-like enzyme